MKTTIDIGRLHRRIQSARESVEEIKRLGEDFPAVARNAERIIASIAMLELNVCDVVDADFELTESG